MADLGGSAFQGSRGGIAVFSTCLFRLLKTKMPSARLVGHAIVCLPRQEEETSETALTDLWCNCSIPQDGGRSILLPSGVTIRKGGDAEKVLGAGQPGSDSPKHVAQIAGKRIGWESVPAGKEGEVRSCTTEMIREVPDQWMACPASDRPRRGRF